jgi:hypothetical protein
MDVYKNEKALPFVLIYVAKAIKPLTMHFIISIFVLLQASGVFVQSGADAQPKPQGLLNSLVGFLRPGPMYKKELLQTEGTGKYPAVNTHSLSPVADHLN